MWLMLLWIELILAPLGYAADGWKGVGICVAVGIVAWGFGFLVYLRLEGRV